MLRDPVASGSRGWHSTRRHRVATWLRHRPTRHSGPEGHRCLERGPVPPVAKPPSRRLRRRRRLLRDQRLSHHRAPAQGDQPYRPRQPAVLLGEARHTSSAVLAHGALGHRRHDDPGRPDQPLAAVPGRGDLLDLVRRELGVGQQGSGLPRRGCRAVTRATLLVSERGGAVLHRHAHPPGGARAGGGTLRVDVAPAGAGRARCRGAGQFRVRRVADVDIGADRLLLHVHAGVGVRRWSAGLAGTGNAAWAAYSCLRVAGYRGHRRDLLHLLAADRIPRLCRTASRSRDSSGDPRPRRARARLGRLCGRADGPGLPRPHVLLHLPVALAANRAAAVRDGRSTGSARRRSSSSLSSSRT